MERSARLAGVASVLLLVLVLLTPSTTAAVGLPDGRAYELVSPSAKGGADVSADSGRTRAARGGGAASFMSLGGFDDVHGTGIATEYIAERSGTSGTSGWTTHGITPLQAPMSFFAAVVGMDPQWEGEFSDELNAGVFRAWSPVTDEDPSVVNVENLYRRADLRTARDGNYQLMTSCPVCAGSPLPAFALLQKPVFVDASADFAHVLFSSTIALTFDATPSTPNLYEWTSVGGLHLAGILPDTACGSPPCPATGSGASPSRSISADGSRIIFTDAAIGQIYERIHDASTVPVSASERTDCADNDPCNGTPEPDPSGTKSASYKTASTDGTRVFFISSEQLTDDDTDGASDLYMWDATKPPGQRLTRLSVDNNPADIPNGVSGVIGASEDGRYVYFAAHGQLVAGGPLLGNPLIYVWRDGEPPTITYIGEMAKPDADEAANFIGEGTLGGGGEARVTPDGRHLLFVSHRGTGLLSAHGGSDYDQTTHCMPNPAGCGEFYVYGADSNELACASCSPSGAPATQEARDVVREGTGGAADATHRNHPISADGHHVVFQTAESLDEADSNGRIDVYEYDVTTHAVHLVSRGTGPTDSFFLDASGDGQDVFFATRDRLVGWDIDDNYDLYDARVGGGFPEPPTAAQPCAGEACRGPASIAPSAIQMPTSGFHGAGDVKSHRSAKVRKCKRGSALKKVRGKRRCVKVKRRRGNADRATTQRRAR